MTILLKAVRLSFPVLFFGYGLVANLAVLTSPPDGYDLPSDGLLSGALTRDLDGLYKQNLPHMDLSFGLIGAVRYSVLGEARQGAIVGNDGWLFSAEEARPVPDDAALSGAVQTVKEVRDSLQAAGVDLVVVPLPAKIDIYRAHSPDPVLGQNLQALLDRFQQQLSRQGIAVVDSRPGLTAAEAAEPVFFATDTHWTPEGAARVAAAVAQSGFVAPGTLGFDRLAEPPVPLTGDLVRFVTTPALAPRLGLQPENVVRVVQTPSGGAGDIFGAVAADVVLVGTSYSANADWGFADALMLSLGRDVINMSAEGLGPLRPMQDYLAGDLFRDAPPAVVIWEIPVRYLTDPAIWPDPAKRNDAEMAVLSPHKEHPDG